MYSDGATKLSATFTIRPKDIATGVSYEAIKKAYDGNAVTLTESEIKLTDNKKTLTAPTGLFDRDWQLREQRETGTDGKCDHTG